MCGLHLRPETGAFAPRVSNGEIHRGAFFLPGTTNASPGRILFRDETLGRKERRRRLRRPVPHFALLGDTRPANTNKGGDRPEIWPRA